MFQWNGLSPEHRILLKGFGGEYTINVHPSIIRTLKGDGNAAIIMTQMLYWSQTEMAEQRNGWFFLTAQKMTKDTGMSYDVQERARRKLVALGVLEQERRGVPARNYYRVNFPRVIELLVADDSSREIKKQANTPASIGESPILDEENPLNIEDNLENITKKNDIRHLARPGQNHANTHVLGDKLPQFIQWVKDTYPANSMGIKVTDSQATRLATRLGTITHKNTRETATATIRTFIRGLENFSQAVKSGNYDSKYVPHFDKWAGNGVRYGADPRYIEWAEKSQPVQKKGPEMVV